MLKYAVVNLINCQNDADLASRFLLPYKENPSRMLEEKGIKAKHRN